jgi:hypothetical protein
MPVNLLASSMTFSRKWEIIDESISGKLSKHFDKSMLIMMAKLINSNFSRPSKAYSVNLPNKIMEDTIIKILDGENNQTTINNNLGGITTKVKFGVKINRINRVGIKETNKDGTITKTKAGVQIKVEIIKDGVTIQIKEQTRIKDWVTIQIKEQARIKVGEIIQIKEQTKTTKIKDGVTIQIKEQTRIKDWVTIQIKDQARIKVGEIIQIKEQTKTTKIKAGETIKTKDGAVTKIPI